MTSNELISIVEDYINDVRDSELSMGVHYGCDCGCGGSYYLENEEEWDAMCDRYDESTLRFKELCKELGISYEG